MRVGPIVAGVATLVALVAGVSGVPAGDPLVASAAPSAAPRSAADGILGSFSPLGSGLNGPVSTLHLVDDSLFVGGQFAAPAGTSSPNVTIWAPDSQGDDTWIGLGGGLGSTVYGLAVEDDSIYAAGTFTGSASRWNGMSWTVLGGGLNGNAFTVAAKPNGSVYVGGEFDDTNPSTFSSCSSGRLNCVASWSGSAWQPLGTGVNMSARAFAWQGDDTLWVGGSFYQAGGSPAANLATWNGANWSPVGGGADGDVRAIQFDGSSGEAYIGGLFDTVGSGAAATPAKALARWDGTAWHALGAGLDFPGSNTQVYTMAWDASRSVLYVGGAFTRAGGSSAYNVGAWDAVAQEWIQLRWGAGSSDNGLNNYVYALEIDDSSIIIGGPFDDPKGSGDLSCGNGGTLRCIAKWTWEPPQGSNSLTATAGSQITITGEGFIGVPPTGGVKIGGTPVTYTRTTTTSITATAPAAYLDGAAITVNGVGGWGDVGTFSTYVPPPPPVYPPSSPREVTATAGDERANVSWLAPSSQGSFPVTSYQVESVPTGGSCLATTLTCEVTGLTNGTPYTFRVRALNGAGWSDWSAPSSSVTPEAPPPPPTPSIVITGSRGEGAESRKVYVDGVAMHLASQQVQAWVRLAGQPAYRAGVTVPVGSDSRFTWQRVTGKKTFVSFTSGDVRSNRVVIPPA